MRALLGAALASLLAGPALAGTAAWTPGWDNFNEPLNAATSGVTWSVSKSRTLSVTFTLNGAVPGKLYQVAILFFGTCPGQPAQFGTFPWIDDQAPGCPGYTRQGVTAGTSSVELGVVTTDASGNGTTTVSTGPLASGTYAVEFTARDGAGCIVGGAGSNCAIDFQAPGPVFGTTTNLVVP
jgi:hypothetical protein